MKKIISIISIAALVVSLTACGGGKLVGRWTGGGYGLTSLEFFSDGTYKSNDANYQGGYSVDGDRLKLDGYIAPDRTYTFKKSGNKLTLYYDSGSSIEFTRQ